RQVETKFLFQIGLVGGINESGGVQQDVDDVAGHAAQQHEDDDRDPGEGHEHQGKASHDISKHLAVSPWQSGLSSIPIKSEPNSGVCCLTDFIRSNRIPLRAKTPCLRLDGYLSIQRSS